MNSRSTQHFLIAVIKIKKKFRTTQFKGFKFISLLFQKNAHFV